MGFAGFSLILAAALGLSCGGNSLKRSGESCTSSSECAADLLCDLGANPHVCSGMGSIDAFVPVDAAPGDDAAPGIDAAPGVDAAPNVDAHVNIDAPPPPIDAAMVDAAMVDATVDAPPSIDAAMIDAAPPTD